MNMRNTIKRFVALITALGLFIIVMMFSVSASGTSVLSSWYLDSYRAWLSARSGGEIAVVVDVQATTYMDEVGASKIQLFESQDGGSTWTLAKVYVKSIHPEMVYQDDYLYYDVAATYAGTAGYKYYAIVTVYAGDSTGSDTRDYTTTVVTARS